MARAAGQPYRREEAPGIWAAVPPAAFPYIMKGGNAMDIGAVTTLIGNVGFPIVACFTMGYWVKYTTDRQDKMLERVTESHEKEIAELREAVENNSKAMAELTASLNGIK